MKMEYVNVNGYLIPKLENGPITDNTIGKYGMMRARYLDEHRPMERDQMLLDGTLAQHLTNIDCEAHPPRRQPKEQPKPVRRRARYCGKLNYKCRKITGFMAFYYRYCALLRKAYKGKVGKRCYYLLRDDFLKYNRYRRQCDLLWKRQITTLDELLTYKENLQAEYSTLTAQRRALYRGKSKTTPADYSEQIQALTARIRELRREITTCADIEMDCEMVQDKVQRAAHRRENPPRERIHRRAY